MTKTVAKPKRRTAGKRPADVEPSLLMLVECYGNTAEASRRLETRGIKINKKTLWTWKTDTHAARYVELQEQYIPAMNARVYERHMGAAKRDSELAELVGESLIAEIDQIPARDKPAAIRNLATSAGINVDKALLVSGQPTARIEQKPAEIIRALKALNVTPETIAGFLEEASEA